MKNIGKTKGEIKKEKQDLLLKRRFIQLGGGFELPPPTSKAFKRNKRRLMRSGTVTKDTLFRKRFKSPLESPDREGEGEGSPKKASFVDQDFMLDMLRIKEEVKEKDKEVEQEEDQPIDIETVMHKKKKKISLKLRNYKYSSIDDIFERRNQLTEQAPASIDQPSTNNKVAPTNGGDEATMIENAKAEMLKPQAKRKAFGAFNMPVRKGVKSF